VPSLRPIAVPEWDEISSNYAAETRAQLDAIMRDFRPAHGGQLILWHGQAGTGKTYALRALAWEWREWCQLHYVVDPDTFFGERADYLMAVLMQPPGMTMGMHVMGGGWTAYGARAIFHELQTEDEEGGGEGEDTSRHWRLLVLEDTGELLTPDAKSIIGQGLSRFLNVVDGLIGQGLRVLVLVTTNEEIRSLHPAGLAPRALRGEHRLHAALRRGGSPLAGRPRSRRRAGRRADPRVALRRGRGPRPCAPAAVGRLRGLNQARGPAASTSSPASGNFSKFLRNIAASSRAFAS
jgi:hypothetical protein